MVHCMQNSNSGNASFGGRGDVAQLHLRRTVLLCQLGSKNVLISHILLEHIAYHPYSSSGGHRYPPEDPFLAAMVTIESITLPAPRTL